MKPEKLRDLDLGLQNEFLPGPLGLLHHFPDRSTLSHLPALGWVRTMPSDLGMLLSITDCSIDGHTEAKRHPLKLLEVSSYLFDILGVGEGNISGAGPAYIHIYSFLGNITEEEAVAQLLAFMGLLFCFFQDRSSLFSSCCLGPH